MYTWFDHKVSKSERHEIADCDDTELEQVGFILWYRQVIAKATSRAQLSSEQNEFSTQADKSSRAHSQCLPDYSYHRSHVSSSRAHMPHQATSTSHHHCSGVSSPSLFVQAPKTSLLYARSLADRKTTRRHRASREVFDQHCGDGKMIQTNSHCIRIHSSVLMPCFSKRRQ